jgi:hypothetical protein
MMTTDEIIEMARQVGMYGLVEGGLIEEFEAFAKLVEERTAAKATEEANARANSSWTLMCKKMVELEREACATVCDDLYRVWTLTDEDDLNPPDALDCKRAIRARAQAERGEAS